MPTHPVLRGVIEHIVDAGIPIQTLVETKWTIAAYGKQTNGRHAGRPIIYLRRERGLPRATLVGDRRRIAPEYFETANPLEELCALAHEFGHHLGTENGELTHDAHSRIIEIVDRAGCSSVSADEKLFVMTEETKAWERCRPVLERLKFTDWTFFEEERTRALETYGRGLKTE